MVSCPICEGDLSVPQDAMQGEIVACADCGTELEVVGLAPVQLQTAPPVEEDWGE